MVRPFTIFWLCYSQSTQRMAQEKKSEANAAGYLVPTTFLSVPFHRVVTHNTKKNRFLFVISVYTYFYRLIHKK